MGGLILDFAVQTFRGVAVFQPVMNGRECISIAWINRFRSHTGVGGNLVAIQASRLSTALHQQGKPGEFRSKEKHYVSTICPNPFKVFCSGGTNDELSAWKSISCFLLENTSSTTRVLLLMAIPGHLTFVFLIWGLASDYTQLSFLFIFLYLTAALIQVKILHSYRRNDSFGTAF